MTRIWCPKLFSWADTQFADVPAAASAAITKKSTEEGATGVKTVAGFVFSAVTANALSVVSLKQAWEYGGGRLSCRGVRVLALRQS